MSKYTPGPWVQCGGLKHNIGKTFGAKKEKGTWIVMCHPFNGEEKDLEEVHANSCLVAAAPELYEALDRAYLQIIEFLNEGDFKREVIFDAGYIVNALAKARGER